MLTSGNRFLYMSSHCGGEFEYTCAVNPESRETKRDERHGAGVIVCPMCSRQKKTRACCK